MRNRRQEQKQQQLAVTNTQQQPPEKPTEKPPEKPPESSHPPLPELCFLPLTLLVFWLLPLDGWEWVQVAPPS